MSLQKHQEGIRCEGDTQSPLLSTQPNSNQANECGPAEVAAGSSPGLVGGDKALESVAKGASPSSNKTPPPEPSITAGSGEEAGDFDTSDGPDGSEEAGESEFQQDDNEAWLDEWDEEYADFEDDTNELGSEYDDDDDDVDPELKKLGTTGLWKRLRDWVHRQGGLVKARGNYDEYLLFDFNDMYQRREMVERKHLKALGVDKGPVDPYEDERWVKFEEPIPITEADKVLRAFGVLEEDIGLLKEWSKGRKVFLKELCVEELRLIVPARSKEPVSVMVNDIYRCLPPWFLLPRAWPF